MPSAKRDDSALEDELRAARPQPRDEVTQNIADRVRPRRSVLRRRATRLQLALAGSIAALAITPVVATGVGGFKGFGGITSNPIANVFKSNAPDRSASSAEYDDDDEVVICVAGTSEVEVSPDLAAFLVGIGIAEFGPCDDDDDDDD